MQSMVSPAESTRQADEEVTKKCIVVGAWHMSVRDKLFFVFDRFLYSLNASGLFKFL